MAKVNFTPENVPASRKANVIGYLVAAYKMTAEQAEQVAANGGYSFEECNDIARALEANARREASK